MTSISRSPPPHSDDSNIQFIKGNIFFPEEYRGALKGVNAVIYSAGMLLEGDYKSLAKGQFDLQKIINLIRERNTNPLTRSRGYDLLNRDGGTSL